MARSSSPFPTLAVIILPLLCITAISGLFLTGRKNGLFDILESSIPKTPQYLPPNADTLQTVLAYAKFHLNNLFVVMAGFFVPIMDLPRNLSLFVQANHFLGGLMSTWMLIYLESYRQGPFDIAKTGAIFFGLLGEFVGVGLAWPLFFLINGISSYGWLSGKPAAAASTVFSSRDLAVLPWSVFIGGGIPALLMLVLPVTAKHGLGALQTWVLIRLFHPIISAVVQVVLKQTTTSNSGVAEVAQAKKNLAGYYRVAYLLSAIPHWMTVVGVGGAYFFPERFSPATAKALAPSAVWPLASPFQQNPAKINNLVEGIQNFLLWDAAMCFSGVLIWSLAVNVGTLGNKSSGVVSGIIRTAIITAFAGPAAAAVTLIREKDEILSNEVVQKVKQ